MQGVPGSAAKRGRFAAFVAACTLVAAACGGSGDGAADASGSTRGEPSPLEARLGFSSDEHERQRQWIAASARTEQAVVSCMQAKGFEYVPRSVAADYLVDPTVGDGTREWAEANGLGITRTFLGLRQALDSSVAADPNAPYLATLDAAQRAGYEAALFGELPPLDATDGPLAYVPGGCQGRAFEDEIAQFETADAFAAELDSLNNRLASDPRVVRLTAAWSECMAARGFAYSDEDALADDIYTRLLGIDAFSDPSVPLDPEAPDVVALLTFERQVAVAGADCRAPLDSDLTAIRAAYEREFLEDHRDRIEALGL